MDNKKIDNKLIANQIKYEIKDSKLQLQHIDASINYYQWCLQHLKNNRPLFLTDDEYNKRIDEYEAKLDKLYIQLNEESNLMFELIK